MSKSFGKKILMLLLVVISSLCFTISLNSVNTVFASGDLKPYDSTVTYSKSDLEDRLSIIEEQIADYQSQLEGKVTVDESGEVFAELKLILLSTIEEIDRGSLDWTFNDVAEKYLFGDTGLNGLLGIYKLASEFYDSFVSIDENGFSIVAVENDFYKFSNEKLINKANEYLSKFDVSNSQIYTGATPYAKYSIDRVVGLADDFYENVVEPIIAEDKENKAKFQELQDELVFYTEYFNSEKFVDAQVAEIVSLGGEGNSVLSIDVDGESQKTVDAIKDAYQRCANFGAWYDACHKLVRDFRDLFADVKTALKIKFDYASNQMRADSNYTFEMLMCDYEAAFETFKNLGELNFYAKDDDGRFVSYNLRYLTTEGENVNVGDAKVVKEMLAHYIATTKRQIATKKLALSKYYGVSAEKSVAERERIACAVAECLVGYGELADLGNGEVAGQATYIDSNGVSHLIKSGRYSYVVNAVGGREEYFVTNGTDIVNAFEQSFELDGTLAYNENDRTKSTSNLKSVKKVSAISSKINDKDGKEVATLTIQTIDENGNAIPYFDVNAKLDIRNGASASVERNIYLILKGKKEGAKKKLSEEDAQMLGGKVLLHYLTLTVYEYKNAALEGYTLLEIDESENLQVLITVDFKDDKLVEQIKDKTCAFGYRHVAVTDVYKEITWGETTMTFKVSNFLNQSQLALAKEGAAAFDLPKLLIIGAVALVGLFFLIWIIVAIVRNKKFKVTFDARGGINKYIKVRVGEKFNHPTAPTRKGYKFIGWYLDKKGTVKFAATQLTRRKNITVYAKWISEKDYAKLSEKRAAGAANATNVTVVLDPRGLVPTTVGDPELAKIEAEKLSYEAKKAEEERKTEEIKLQALREIEEAKKNGEARTKAEEEAAIARAELDKAIADREILESDARADERNKCLDELRAISDRANAEDSEEKIKAAYDEGHAAGLAEAKAKEEAEMTKKALEDAENKRKAEEEARIKAAYEEGVAARLAEEAKEKELAEEEARAKAEEEERIKNAIALGVAEKLAEESALRAEEEAKLKAEHEEKLRLAEEARAKAEEEARARLEAEVRAREEAEARLRAEAEERARLEAEARAKAEEEARLAEEKARAEEEARLAEEKAKAEEEARLAEERAKAEAEANKFDVAHVFDELKAEIFSYTDADDLTFGLEESVPACAMKVVGNTIELEVNLDKEDCLRKAYKVTDGEKLPVKFVLASDDDIDEANELIEETMLLNGLKKTCKAVVTAATEQTRVEGFEHGLSKDKIADTPEEFYKLLRVYAQSFVLADDGDVEEKVLVKMFLDRARVYLYVNRAGEGLNECDGEMAAFGLKSFMTVKSCEDCKKAVSVIGAMMRENGLIRFPSEVSVAGDDCTKGYTYTLKK